jgi:hypothetical protein
MHPRIVVTGATTAITRRTTMRKAFLGPWHPLVSHIWLYSLADAQLNTDVQVHLTNLVVSHQHTTVTTERDNLPDFLRRVHRDTSCALNTLLIHERYDAPHELFDDRSTHAMRLLDAAAQMTQLAYEHNNCVAAGLVQRPEHMSSNVVDFDLWKRGELVVKRPPIYFDHQRPDEIALRITPPPLLLQAFDGDVDRLVRHMKRLSDHAGQQLRAARARPAMGAQAVQRLHPWSEPRSLRESGGKRVPTFRIGARGIDGRLTSIAAAQETHEFRREHRAQRLARKAGDIAAVFPFGTYDMRVHHNAPVEAEPKATALVTKPGPLLHDIQAELATERAPQERHDVHAQSITLLDEARAALTDEAEDLIADNEMTFDTVVRAASSRRTATATNSAVGNSSHAPGERGDAVVQHRFHKRNNDPRTAPRRVITLRDARRGRPPGKHGADPPA